MLGDLDLRRQLVIRPDVRQLVRDVDERGRQHRAARGCSGHPQGPRTATNSQASMERYAAAAASALPAAWGEKLA